MTTLTAHTRNPVLADLTKRLNAAAGLLPFERAWATNCCAKCQRAVQVADFTKPAARAEWNISALCQSCQDTTFGTGREEA